MSQVGTPRPAINDVGRFVFAPDGTIEIRDWVLGPCLRNCRCHRFPRLAVADDRHGRLGLVKAHPCDCCEPWDPDELIAIVRFLAELAEMATTT